MRRNLVFQQLLLINKELLLLWRKLLLLLLLLLLLPRTIITANITLKLFQREPWLILSERRRRKSKQTKMLSHNCWSIYVFVDNSIDSLYVAYIVFFIQPEKILVFLAFLLLLLLLLILFLSSLLLLTGKFIIWKIPRAWAATRLSLTE